MLVSGPISTRPCQSQNRGIAPWLASGGFDLPTHCYYEVLPPDGSKVQIVYRFSWPDERHPLAAVHRLYRLWRRLYFASPEDIEFVWVEADLASGLPTRIAYESPEGLYVVRHRYREHEAGFPVSGAHPVLRVASWNHIFETAGVSEPASATPLRPLDEGLYRELRMGRRSQPRL